ncbi:MAG: family 20 glycosylhydrolase [bacterium]|nr:family 20 glycosylhydrolase [bacterium]
MNRITVLICLVLSAVIASEPTLAGSRRSTGVVIMPEIIPAPRTVEFKSGAFHLNAETRIVIDNPALEDVALRLQKMIVAGTGLEPGIARASASGVIMAPIRDTILLSLRGSIEELGTEGYHLEVSPREILIQGAETAGVFYGIQTLRQLLPVEFEPPAGDRWAAPHHTAGPANQDRDWPIPNCLITDSPRFPWRGMLLDCCRHFMPVDLIKRQLDLLALHKMNRFHWHLTEDQGWRIRIDKYPLLTEIGAWRDEEGTLYGGFYTKGEIREVVAYAAALQITVVPEIGLPGHSLAALAAYPEYSCTGGPFNVATQWGVFKDVYCAGNDSTFTFLEDILDEVIALFPGEYLHIGGDECPKERWSGCPRCRERIRIEGLADEDELQSWFIRRIGAFLETRNRRLIGWDEILEGGLAPGATVQSWRGTSGAIAAARAGQDAIVSPTSHAYFDYPVGNISLRQVFAFDPVPEELTPAEERFILGGECNLWTERITPEGLDVMTFPRLCAMAEKLWSPKDHRTYDDFHLSLTSHYLRLDRLGVNYGEECEPLRIRTSLDNRKQNFKVVCEIDEREATVLPNLDIYYTTDGTEPNIDSHRYKRPLNLPGGITLVARAFLRTRPYGSASRRTLLNHQALGCAVSTANPCAEKYNGGGENALLDGIRGSDSFRDGHWQGYEVHDLEVLVDLGRPRQIGTIKLGCLQEINSWIFMPRRVEFSISLDGVSFETVGQKESSVSPRTQDLVREDITLNMEPKEVRYIRLVAANQGKCPPWHYAAGGDAWIFVDEIIVE